MRSEKARCAHSYHTEGARKSDGYRRSSDSTTRDNMEDVTFWHALVAAFAAFSTAWVLADMLQLVVEGIAGVIA